MLIKLDEARKAIKPRTGEAWSRDAMEAFDYADKMLQTAARLHGTALPTVSVTDEPWVAMPDNIHAEAYAKFIMDNLPNAPQIVEVANHSVDFDGNETFTKKSFAIPTVSDGWEDIATANKNEMILGHADGMVRLVMWEGGRWVQVGATIEPGWFEPTEWKPLGPLPAPPSE